MTSNWPPPDGMNTLSSPAARNTKKPRVAGVEMSMKNSLMITVSPLAPIMPISPA